MKEKHLIVPYLDESYMFEYIDEGANGTCYRTKDNQVFKKYHSSITNYEDYKRLVGIKSSFFVFPNESVYLEEYGEDFFLGYLMEYIKGSKFSELPMSTNIRELFGKIDLAEKEIKILTQEENLSLYDLHENNVILTKDKLLKFLDTDLYAFEYNEMFETYKNNIKELGLFVLSFFLKDYPMLGDKLMRYYELCIYNGKVKPSIVLFEALDEMERILKEEIITFNDFYRAKRILLK